MPRKLDGTYIQTGSITTTQLSSAVTNQISAGGGPRVTSLVYPGNDTAANTVGGQTVYINGSGFETNNAIYINGNAVPSKSFISASNVSFTTPALSAGIYPVYFINTDTGATAIFVPGLSVSAEPAWVTGASLSEIGASDAWNISLSATGDAPITYALANGSSLPTGVTLAANGLISGTITSPPETDTTYTFTVVATDAQNQDSSRQFSITTSVGEGVLFANNVLLIHANGTNNQNNHTFLDSSNNNFTITRSGNTTQGSFSPFSQTGWSAYTKTSGSNEIQIVDNANLRLGAGNFTAEGWFYPEVTGSTRCFYTKGVNTTGGIIFGCSKTQILCRHTGQTDLSASVTLSGWNHIAWVRSGNTLTIYLNGVSVASSSVSFDQNDTATVYIGAVSSVGSDENRYYGYASNFRIVKGTALYTSTFTPPTAALTAVANTQLLTCQSNRFIDNSTNAFTLTRNGDVSVQAFSPFAPTAAYSTANVGGSLYLDGSGDYLNMPSSSLLLGSNDFSFEAWVYITSAWSTAAGVFYGQGDGSSVSGSSYGFVLSASATSDVYVGSSSYSITSPNPSLSAWAHVAYVRTGGTFSSYLNGTRIGTRADLGSSSINNGSTANKPTIGGVNGGSTYPLTGYISGVKAIIGSGGYNAANSTISIPTSPPTNIANTSLLLNFTNAGIFDQTAKNILETVGDAKLSTAQYKYGSASMYFDGTGDYLQSPTSQFYNLFGGDMTIEFWVYPTNISGRSEHVMAFVLDDSNRISLYFNSTAFTFWTAVGGGGAGRVNTSAVSTNTWSHIALTKSGSTFTLYLNGTSQGTSTTTIYPTSAMYLRIGVYSPTYSTDFLTGYLDDIRITKGYARYTANFTAPSSAFKDK